MSSTTLFRTLAMTMIAAAVVVLGFVSTAPADAAVRNPTCMSRVEFRHIKTGMTMTSVARIVGSRGKVSVSSSSGGFTMVIRQWTGCGRFTGSAGVTLMNGRVTTKMFL